MCPTYPLFHHPHTPTPQVALTLPVSLIRTQKLREGQVNFMSREAQLLSSLSKGKTRRKTPQPNPSAASRPPTHARGRRGERCPGAGGATSPRLTWAALCFFSSS